MGKESVSLSHLMADIKITLQGRYVNAVWVVAEISDYNLNRSGHCYMELVEKDSISDKIIAKTRATIWAYTFRTLKAYFETSTGEYLRAGLKVLLKVSVEFHEIFGFSLNVQDIDPNYTLGDLARKKAQIIKQLNDEGVLEMNKGLVFPLVPQRIAVISSETAAGYGDFTDQLSKNQGGIKFYTHLFQAIMQGEKAPESIIMALEQVYERINDFDIVAIIRGGGSKSDLSAFDDYDLAYFITQFPLPVVSGIGHERDDTVTDIVAHTRLKTPTAVAGFFIEKAFDLVQKLEDYEVLLGDMATDFIENNNYLVENLSKRLQVGSQNLLLNKQEHFVWAKSNFINAVKKFETKQFNKLEEHRRSLATNTKSYLQQEQKLCELRKQRLNRWLNNYFNQKENKLKVLHDKIELVNPERILERGFAWIKHDGKIVKNASELKKGDEIEITLAKGKVRGEVTGVQ